MQNFEVKNKKDSFADRLKSQILSGRLKVGQKLPPERELAENSGISRCSVNQALLDLERAGFIRIVPRKGAYVADYFTEATPETLSAIMSYDADMVDSRLFSDLMDMRILIECQCVRLACENRGEDTVEALHRCTEAVFAADAENIAEAIFRFHRCIVRASGNLAYAMIFQSFEKLLRSLMGLHYLSKAELSRMLPMYGALASAVLLGEADRAVELMREILTGATGYLSGYLSEKEN